MSRPCRHVWLFPWQEHKRCFRCGKFRTLGIGENTLTMADNYLEVPVVATPATPAANFGRLFFASGARNLNLINSAGVVTRVNTFLMTFGSTSATTGFFLLRGGNGSSTAGEGVNNKIVCPVTGYIRTMFCLLGTAPGGAATTTLTVRVNGADSALATVISDPNTTGNASADVAVTAGDVISVRVDFTGASPTLTGVSLDII